MTKSRRKTIGSVKKSPRKTKTYKTSVVFFIDMDKKTKEKIPKKIINHFMKYLRTIFFSSEVSILFDITKHRTKYTIEKYKDDMKLKMNIIVTNKKDLDEIKNAIDVIGEKSIDQTYFQNGLQYIEGETRYKFSGLRIITTKE